ncbi:MAG TPA: NAD-dependent succinate-semialdehyde dehydrogenase [Pseudothermotoga sp.]|nr:NAD-dependent succinate-semialdehyde dehydrogenase [Pseudothermotoga sp.]HOK82991.1 NAD-dependent succinate-semialdehyde dehydrogenase [Pseudothermotoga sp.]HPP69840.1 NAD-dependent succinate-semialdehyde dehydrogenase [Pseudothermotoga sp.]
MKFRCVVDGELVESSSGRFLEVRNPANVDEVVGEVPAMTAEEAQKAVESSFAAFKTWSNLSPIKRAEIIKRAVKIAEERSEEISRLLTLENGKTIKESREELRSSLESIRYFAESVLNIFGETYPVDKTDRLSITLRQPVGVVSAIVPWNYPLLLLSWKIGPAIAVGCTVVAKPSHYTPLSTLKLSECFLEAGIPKGVLNVLTGKTNEIGKILTEHHLISKIAFTGSTSAGRNIMISAASTVKRLTLELGGNCPLIVFEDADLNAAVKGAVRRSFRNAGQVCNAINRIYVHKSIYRDFVDLFVQETKRIKIGNGLREDVEMGPLTTKEGWETVEQYVKEATSKGAKVLYGGKKPAGDEFEKGYFYEPTVLVNTDRTMKIVKNEVFGPTAPIMSFESFEEAIEKANDTEYGLVAYVYTKDLSKALRAAKLIESGTVGINNVSGGEFAYPYGGWKQSGFGVENSHHVFNEYLYIKHVRVDY